MSGSWVTTDQPTYQMEVRACDACGAMISGMAFETELSGRVLCGPECEELEERVNRLRTRYATDVDVFSSIERSVSSLRD